MISTVGEALAEFYAHAIEHHEAVDRSRGTRLRGMADFLKLTVLSVVDITLPILAAYRRLVDAASLYSATTQTDVATRKTRFRAFEVALHNFGAVLDAAKPSEQAMILGTVDTTPVPNPVANILKPEGRS